MPGRSASESVVRSEARWPASAEEQREERQSTQSEKRIGGDELIALVTEPAMSPDGKSEVSDETERRQQAQFNNAAEKAQKQADRSGEFDDAE